MQPIGAQAGDAVTDRLSELASALVERELARHPELAQRDGEPSREESLQDAVYHLSHLAQALALDNRALFLDYVAWAKVLLVQRKVLASDLARRLDCLAEVLLERLPAPAGALAADFAVGAARAIPEMADDMPTFLHAGEPLSPIAHQYLQALRRGERQVASRLVLDAVAGGAPVKEIYMHVFQPAQHEIGRLWQTNRMTVAQEHYCSAATQLIMSQLYPYVFATAKTNRSMVGTCVSGDLHEIGVRMVADFFEMEGWNSFYLGANTPHPSVISEIVDRDADVLAISATISYHVGAVRDLIHAVRQHPTAGRIRILVGGYPFNQDPELFRKLGADGTAFDAPHAVATAHELLTAVTP
jgi:methanogenic corrinoid protein MtbC1